MLPDFGRADRIGEFWSYPESRTFAELLLIDCEEDRTLRAVLVGMLSKVPQTLVGHGEPLPANSWVGMARGVSLAKLPERARESPATTCRHGAP